jgi:hypothetical protein
MSLRALSPRPPVPTVSNRSALTRELTTALEAKGYTTAQAQRVLKYDPDIALKLITSEGQVQKFFAGIMSVPQDINFKKRFDITESKSKAQLDSGGGILDRSKPGQHASLVFEIAVPKSVTQKDRNSRPALVPDFNVLPLKDLRAVIAQVGVVLDKPGISSPNSPLVWLTFDEAFNAASGKMRTVNELKDIATKKPQTP